jgi:hypothetical protein
MRNDPLVQLLIEIHNNVDLLCEDLEHDRPDLADAIRKHAAWIPRPDELMRGAMPSTTKATVRQLGPLLYDALDEGLVDARHFDALMVERAAAERVIDAREPR